MAKNIEVAIAYIHGRLEAQLETFALSLGIPSRELTRRLATLLSGSKNGQVLGPEDRVLVRGQTTEGSKATRKVAVASSPSKNRAPSAIKKYWMRMTPEQRSAEVKRRVLMSKKKEKG